MTKLFRKKQLDLRMPETMEQAEQRERDDEELRNYREGIMNKLSLREYEMRYLIQKNKALVEYYQKSRAAMANALLDLSFNKSQQAAKELEEFYNDNFIIGL